MSIATIGHIAAEMLTVLVNEMKRLVYFLSCGLSFVLCACFKLTLLIDIISGVVFFCLYAIIPCAINQCECIINLFFKGSVSFINISV